MIKLERGLVQRSLLYCLERGYFSLIRYLLESGTGNSRERDSMKVELVLSIVVLSIMTVGHKISP